MKHHKKSNQGRFSKKQKRASRQMMKNRGGYQRRSDDQFDPTTQLASMGLIAGLLAKFGRRKKI